MPTKCLAAVTHAKGVKIADPLKSSFPATITYDPVMRTLLVRQTYSYAEMVRLIECQFGGPISTREKQGFYVTGRVVSGGVEYEQGVACFWPFQVGWNPGEA